MSNVDNFFKVNLKIIKAAGLWVADQGESFTVKWIYIVTTAVSLGYSVVFNIPMEMLAFKYSYHKIEELMKNISIGGTHFLACVKIYIWYYNRKEILRMMDMLQEKARSFAPIADFDRESIIQKEKKLKDISTIVFLLLGCNVGISAYIAGMWALFTDYEKFEKYETGPSNETIYHYTQKLPFYAVVPFTYDTSRSMFAVALAYNCFPTYHYAWIIIGIDTVFTSLVSFLSCYIQVLQGAFETIRLRSLKTLNIPNEPMLHNPKELNEVMMKEMNVCVDHLQLIFDMCERVENIFTYLTLTQVLSSQILLCASLYMVSAIPINSKPFASELIYLLALEMQIALYCFFGNRVTVVSEDIPLSLYRGDWYSASGPFKKSMLITMLRTRRPICFTLGKFSPLTLSTFVTIARASYSFFAIIKKKNSTDM